MTDSRIKLRNPWLAAGLALLVPGLGHAYQGRLFKAATYFVCITGMFIAGARMAEWKPIQAPPFSYRDKNRMLMLLKYSAQFGMGLPSLAALVQTRRFLADSNHASQALPGPLSAPFEGRIVRYGEIGGRIDKPENNVTGTLSLEPIDGPAGPTIGGHLDGTDGAGNRVHLELGHQVDLARPIAGSEHRAIQSGFVEPDGNATKYAGRIDGSIPRALGNWLFVPMNDNEEQQLEGRLGKWHELAMVLTWIAGLLNMLAVWDALAGPAWGYDDQSDANRTPVAKAA